MSDLLPVTYSQGEVCHYCTLFAPGLCHCGGCQMCCQCDDVLMSEAERFFYNNAGWSHRADEDSETGRIRCAQELAEVEQWATEVGISFLWEDDWLTTNHVAEFDCYEEEPSTCETCLATFGTYFASLGCIDDATDDYRRVIQAELASEILWQWENDQERETA